MPAGIISFINLGMFMTRHYQPLLISHCLSVTRRYARFEEAVELANCLIQRTAGEKERGGRERKRGRGRARWGESGVSVGDGDVPKFLRQ